MKINTVPKFFVCGDYQTFLLHQALDDFLGHTELAAAKRRMHSPVAVTAVITVEDFRENLPDI